MSPIIAEAHYARWQHRERGRCDDRQEGNLDRFPDDVSSQYPFSSFRLPAYRVTLQNLCAVHCFGRSDDGRVGLDGDSRSDAGLGTLTLMSASPILS